MNFDVDIDSEIKSVQDKAAKHMFVLSAISDLKSEKEVIIIIDYNIHIINSVIKFRDNYE